MTEPVFEAFAVVGLALPLSGAGGEDVGLKGLPAATERMRFRPALLDHLQLSGPTKLPTGLPTVRPQCEVKGSFPHTEYRC